MTPYTPEEREGAAGQVDLLSRYPFEETPTMRDTAIALQCRLNRLERREGEARVIIRDYNELAPAENAIAWLSEEGV